MIQRIQTVYLLLSAVLGTVCLCLPLGHFHGALGERVADLYNLWLRLAETGQHQFGPWALFALLLFVVTLTLLNIFLYRRRALQMRVATFCMILLVCYYGVLGFLVYRFQSAGDLQFRPTVAAALPFVCLVLDYLAFRGVLKDELLVRAQDRLR